MPDDLNAMAVFVAVADTKGFRAAGDRLGVSGSAVSQAMRRLQELRAAVEAVGELGSEPRGTLRLHVASGELVSVLEEFSTPVPGFYLYYPQRRHASPALRALIDFLRRQRKRR